MILRICVQSFESLFDGDVESKQIFTSKTKFSLAAEVRFLIFAFEEFSANSERFFAILLCSLRKRVWMEASPGCTMALVSPAVSSLAVGLGLGLDWVGIGIGKPHWRLIGRCCSPPLLNFLLLCVFNLAPSRSPSEVSSSEP